MQPKKPEIEIWECDPLVITDLAGEVIFGGKCKIEFAPDDASRETGSALALGLELHGKDVKIEVEGRTPYLPAPTPGFFFAIREGRTLWGHNDDGESFTWFINADADRALAQRAAGLRPGVVGPDDMENAT